jgi:hypothetical protein
VHEIGRKLEGSRARKGVIRPVGDGGRNEDMKGSEGKEE